MSRPESSTSLDPASILADLTAAQREAAAIVDGAVLVLAGPGSGKTRVITRRIAHLIAQGIPAWQILALTFTNKAASEMRQRVDALVPAHVPGRRGLTVSTFHSFCALLLRRDAEAAGLKEGFSIYDTGDQRAAMKEAIEEAGLAAANFAPAAVLSFVSTAKNALQDAEAYAATASDFTSRAVAKAYRAYEAILRRSNAVDFDDLLLKVAVLLRSDTAVLRKLQERYRYILVDEYQDTNHAQFVIAGALAARSGNLFVVGDPDQSIYGWRGADLSNILDFEEQFPGATVLRLGQNFRSTGHIVATAAAVIENNRRRKHKPLSTELGDGTKPIVARCMDEHDEADRVVEFLEARAAEGVDYRRMAVLYRMNALSRVAEDGLRKKGIPYVVARGTAFWDRQEVKDVLAYLRTIANSSDEGAIRRIINVPARGIGDASVRKLHAAAIDRGVPIADFLVSEQDFTAIVGRSAKSVRDFGRMLRSWRERAEALPAGELASLVADVLRESGLDGAAALARSEEDVEAARNRDEIVSAASEFRLPDDDTDGGPPPTALEALRRFLESVALVSDQDLVDADRGAVTLLTLHAAKGLEFEAVAIIGLEQGILPHQRSSTSPDDEEEERRLFFVGMTRAERHLLVTTANSRVVRGERQSRMESLFLREMPTEHIVREDRRSTGDFGGIEYDDVDGWSEEPVHRRFPVGCTVRHPLFGVGRVEHAADLGERSNVRVAFRTAGVKTIYIAYGKLVRVEA
jgi:DNA helicase-2/ATP-dependent DNA helicase PcrA